MRYYDTADQSKQRSMAHWFIRNVKPGIRAFFAQFGYFDYRAFKPFIVSLAEEGKLDISVHLVIGANNQDVTQDDLKKCFQQIQMFPESSLVVVSFSNALFHPKVVLVKRYDDSFVVIVGSSNLTLRGMSSNVEAFIELDTSAGDDEDVMKDIYNSISYWRKSPLPPGAYRIESFNDIDELVNNNIISLTRSHCSKLFRSEAELKKMPAKGLPSRKVEWKPKVKRVTKTFRARALKKKISLKWSKKLSASDAQIVRPGTNPTGKLRLSKAGHDIDITTWFKDVFLDKVKWIKEVRGGNSYDVAFVDFRISLMDRDLGVVRLMIDHSAHRIAGQNNVPTYLAWGPVLMSELGKKSYVGKMVTLERSGSGDFYLSIG